MKKILFLIPILVFSALIHAQETMYIMKGGVATYTIPITEVDSLTFYAPSGGTVNVASVSLNTTTASIAVGATQQLTATVSPANATNKSVTWGSSNNGVATVNSSGLVTAVSAGSATITVTTADGNRTATSTITVTGTVSNACLNTTGDFSDGLTGWSGWTSQGCCASQATADFGVVGGEALVSNISSGAVDWEVSLVGNYNFEQGKTYKVTFDARSTSPRSIGVALRECVTGDCGTNDLQGTINIGTTMQEYSYVYTQNQPTYVYGQIMFWFGASTQNVYLDNICVTETTTGGPGGGPELKVMAIGDSITQGAYPYSGTYRQDLYFLLQGLGYNVNMIGARSNSAGNNDPFNGNMYPPALEGEWDQDHEAYWGYTSGQVFTQMTNRQGNWEAAPDIATIHLGTNNLGSGTGKADITKIIGLLRTKNPNITIFVAHLITSSNASYATNIVNYNTSQINGISSLSTDNSRVIEVNLNNILNTATDFIDPLHPNSSGATKMAAKWFEAIQAAGFTGN